MRHALLTFIALGFAASAAELPRETPDTRSLPQPPSPHWLWVNDMVFNYMGDGRATLIDGDTGLFLGMLSTGVAFQALTLPSDYSAIYSAETYYTRSLRGERTDVVTVYDPAELEPIAEIRIPPKRLVAISGGPMLALTDDDRFMLITNFTPAQSVSVVDVKARRFAGEIETPGCAHAYVTGPRRFHMLCADGGVLTVNLDEQGGAASRRRSDPFFDPSSDPVQEEAGRAGARWYFLSNTGDVYTIDGSGEQATFPGKWSLLTAEDRTAGWLPGGVDQVAMHAATGRLYVVMHRGGRDTHKEPGEVVWVYDVASRKRVQQIRMNSPVTSLHVTRDERPLLAAAFIAVPEVQIYDATSGEHLRTVGHVGASPSTIDSP
jgi:methylamine dehydrogenase heavy chain